MFSVVTDDIVLLLTPLLRQHRHARCCRLILGITITEMHVAFNETMCVSVPFANFSMSQTDTMP